MQRLRASFSSGANTASGATSAASTALALSSSHHDSRTDALSRSTLYDSERSRSSAYDSAGRRYEEKVDHEPLNRTYDDRSSTTHSPAGNHSILHDTTVHMPQSTSKLLDTTSMTAPAEASIRDKSLAARVLEANDMRRDYARMREQDLQDLKAKLNDENAVYIQQLRRSLEREREDAMQHLQQKMQLEHQEK